MKARITILLILLTAFFANASEKSYTAAPDNDNCSSATTILVNGDLLCNSVVSGTVNGATASDEITGGDCSGLSTKNNDDVWFKFVATQNNHTVSIDNISGDITNLYHIVYTGTCDGTMNALICSDPNVSNPSGLTVGQTYYIRVFTNSTANNHNTTFDICVGTTVPITIPSNDDCASAETITSIPFSNNVDGRGATGGIVSVGCGSMNDGVWYKIQGDGNNLKVYTLPVLWDLEIAVYTGGCGSFTCVASTDTGGVNVAEELEFTSVNGTDYYINIGNKADVDQPEGAFFIEVTSTVLSIDELKEKGFTYFPNPVSNDLYVQAKEDIKHIAVYNSFGQELRLFSPSDLKAKIDLSGLPIGPYFVRAYVGNAVGMFKIIKKK